MTELLITQFITVIIATYLAVYFYSANVQLRKSLVESKRREKRLARSEISWQNVFLKKVGAGSLKPAPREKKETDSDAVPRVVAASQAIETVKREQAENPRIRAPRVPKSVGEQFLEDAAKLGRE